MVTQSEVKFASVGAIVRIRLRNFMTYTDVEMNPGPNLNMILGPNGTGKSAIVCSIIVGLAGDVGLTGRASTIASLVKKGTDCAKTEIELYNDQGPNFIIERTIKVDRSESKTEHKSEWKINNKSVKKEQVTALTKKLSIKVDNLCQFLPQDSVTNFVKMDKQNLLCSTLEAAGDAQLVHDYKMLIDRTKTVEEKRLALEILKRQCQENEINANRLKEEVERFRRRENLVKEKNCCSSKKYYLKFLKAKELYDKCLAETADLRAKLTRMEKAGQPYQRAIDLHREEERRLVESSSGTNRELLDIQRKITETEGKIDKRKLNCQEEFLKFKSKQEMESRRNADINIKQQELDAYECRVNEVRDVDYSREIEKIDKELNVHRQNILKCGKDKTEVENRRKDATESLERLRNQQVRILAVNERKQNTLLQRSKETSQILNWLVKNRNNFQENIFLPMMCEINVKEVKHAGIVEHAIPGQELLAFVCQNETDLRLFTQLVYDEFKTRCNVILAPTTRMEDYERETSRRPDIEFETGVKPNYLIDLIDAPDPIKRYLCGNYKFHLVPVFDQSEEKMVKKLLEMCPKFYADKNFYSVSTSRYDGETMTVTDQVREARLLAESLDRRELAINNKRISEQEENLKILKQRWDEYIRVYDTCKREWGVLADRLRELKHKDGERKRLEDFIKMKRDEIKRLKEGGLDIEAERQKLQSSVDKINIEMMENLESLVELHINYGQFKSLTLINCLLARVAAHNHKVAKRRLRAAEQNRLKLVDELKTRESDTRGVKLDFEDAKAVAQERLEGFSDGTIDDSTLRKFNKIAENTIEELDCKIEQLAVRIRAIHKDKELVKEYNRQNDELNDKRLRIQEMETAIRDLDSERSEVKEDWRQKVGKVISVVNKNYKDFMQKLNYDGQVKLDFKIDDPDDFSAYGVSILVKYRDEELIPLTSSRQSGGERSVATMIYMLALQTQTTVPFRCVDEINQGMDKENERKVFELLVETADTSSSQYFLVSPKLLDNLPYSEKMKIHVVFNGKKLHLNWNDITV